METPDVSGLRLEDHNHLKYTISLTRVGHEIFIKVFGWGYIDKSKCIKEALFSIEGYSNVKFKKDFNASQREKINKGETVTNFDITLIYKLFQLVCGLKDATDSVWVTAASDSLEFCIYSIKSKRNELAHEQMFLSPKQMAEKIEDLRLLFIRTIEKAGVAFSVDSSRVNNFISSINRQLDAIKSSPVPAKTETEYQREVECARKACLIEDGQKELINTYLGFCQVSIAPWLLSTHCVSVKEIFTKPRLKREESQIMQRQLSVSESYVDVSDILQTCDCNGNHPNVIIISALSGMGKSTLLKFIIENEMNNRGNTKCGNFDLILSLECRRALFTSLNEMAALLLPRTAATMKDSEFLKSLLSLDILLLVDDVDELDHKSFAIFMGFVKVMSQRSQTIVTASRGKAKEAQRKVASVHKNVMLLELEGITAELVLPHLKKLTKVLNLEKKIDPSGEEKLCSLIQAKHQFLQDHLMCPEILGLIALGWVLAPDKINVSTTVTEIFLLVEDLLLYKLVQNILASSVLSMSTSVSLNSNLRKFIYALSSTAAECVKNGKSTIDSESLLMLGNKCRSLKLPEDSVLSSFLNYVDQNEGSLFSTGQQVSFPRQSTLHYYAARFVSQSLLTTPSVTSIRSLLGIPDVGIGVADIITFQSMMKYLVGMLSALAPAQLGSRAKEIVHLLKESSVKSASDWLQYIEEAKQEPTITHEILKEMGAVWEVEDFAISHSFVNVLKCAKPHHVCITACIDPSDIPHLRSSLEVCAAKDQMGLSLHLYKHFWSEKRDFSDEFLDIVCDKNSVCSVEHFAGRLSRNALSRLPGSLRRLALHVMPDMIGDLNETLPKLKELQMLYVNFDVPVDRRKHSFPCLNMPYRQTVLTVDLWRVIDETIDWACDVFVTLSKTYSRIGLRKSGLDGKGCKKWLDGLHQRGVKVFSIVVGSTCDVTEEEIKRLKQLATKLTCGTFHWIKV